MDRTDRQIVELLQANGRRSNVEIAREVGVSEGTVRKRIDKLVSTGTVRILGVVDPPAVGYGTRALIFLSVELAHAERAARALRDMREVLSVYWVTGEYDVVVDAAFCSDTELMSFLTGPLAGVPGIVNSRVAHVLRTEKLCHEWQVPSPPPPTVMVVDDDPDFVEITRMVLQEAGYTVTSASNGQDALQAMSDRPPSMVILDIMMDGVLDGWDASWRMRSAPGLRDIPILVVSSITATDYLGMFPTDDDNLIDNFLSKPVSPGKLLSEVRRLLRE